MKDDRVYLEHIRDALDDIATYTRAGRVAFFDDRMRQDATLRKCEKEGRAATIGCQLGNRRGTLDNT